MIMMILLFFILALLLYFSIKNPTHFIILYILSQSKFLGFIDLSTILIMGNDIAFPLFNTIAILVSILRLFNRSISKLEIIILFFIAYLYLYGLLLPVVMNYSTLSEAIFSSKTFMYYGFLFYLIIHRRTINLDKVISFLFLISYYLVSVEIVYYFSSFSPPSYIETYFNSSDTYQRIYYPTYISFALIINIYYYTENKISKLKFFISNIFFLIGILLSNYTSLFITSTLLIIFTLFYYRNQVKVLKGTLISIITLSLIYLFISFNDNLKREIFKSIESRVMGDTIELISRDLYNKFRWDAIRDEPYLGFGFIHKNAAILNKYNNDINNRFMESLNVIDSGYVDLLTKFGYINTIFFFIFLILISYQISNKHLRFVYLLFIVQYSLINYTWAVFMYQHGIIPLSIMISIIIAKNNTNERRYNGTCYSNNNHTQSI